MQDKARGNSDQDKATHIFWMAQGIFGGNGTAEGVADQVKWFLDVQRIHQQFHIIHQIFHAHSVLCGIIAQAMSPHIRCNDAHKLSKETQLVDPLHRVASISVNEDKRVCSPFWFDVDDAETTKLLRMSANRCIDGSPVEFNI